MQKLMLSTLSAAASSPTALAEIEKQKRGREKWARVQLSKKEAMIKWRVKLYHHHHHKWRLFTMNRRRLVSMLHEIIYEKMILPFSFSESEEETLWYFFHAHFLPSHNYCYSNPKLTTWRQSQSHRMDLTLFIFSWHTTSSQCRLLWFLSLR